MKTLLFILLLLHILTIPAFSIESITLLQLASFPEDYVGKTVVINDVYVTLQPLSFGALDDNKNFGITLHDKNRVSYTTWIHKYNRKKVLSFVSKKQAKYLVDHLESSEFYPIKVATKVFAYEDGDGYNAEILYFILNGASIPY